MRLFFSVIFALSAGLSPLSAETDPYGGNLSLRTEATGFFRVEKFEDRWLFVTPDGHGYLALGANHVGKYLDQQAEEMGLLGKFDGDRAKAAAFLADEMRAMALTAGEAYAPIADELKSEFPWIANLRFPTRSKFAFDVFDPEVLSKIRQSVVKQCADFREDPMVLGVAFADLPVWDERRLAFYEKLPADVPGARALKKAREEGKSDEEFLGQVADVLYAELLAATREGAPNHLFIGERHRLRGTPDEVLKSVGKYVDVFPTQALILSPQRPPEWQVFQREGYDHEHSLVGDKPMIIVDWAAPFSLRDSFKTDRGEIKSESVAADEAADFLVEAMSLPYMIGVFKCQLIGLHGNDHWFEGKARRTYLKDDGSRFDVRTERTRKAHLKALEVGYQLAKGE